MACEQKLKENRELEANRAREEARKRKLEEMEKEAAKAMQPTEPDEQEVDVAVQPLPIVEVIQDESGPPSAKASAKGSAYGGESEKAASGLGNPESS